MQGTLHGIEPDRLERSCDRRDSIRFGTGAPGLERAEVFLSGAFEPHRHDTYAIGITTAGVQVFGYRGSRRVCLPGQIHVLHPDETHDGGAGTEDGFGYRILYLAPELIRSALDGEALPFVADPVQPMTPATRHVASFLRDMDESIGDLALAELVAAIADLLRSLAGRPAPRRVTIDTRAMERVRDHLTNNAREQTPASELERIAGTDRFTIARNFRRAFGTSPDRYRTIRRLELTRAAIEGGTPLSLAAADAGFADQSHMTRQFRKTYGLTPARWVRAVAAVGTIPDHGSS
jgi:AraC-like DNA-binding protein